MLMLTCELGSLNAAASAMYVAQPAMTQAIAKLEQYFQAELLLRQRTGSVPTPAGQLLYERCQRFFQQLQAAIMHVPDRAQAPTEAVAAARVSRLTTSQVMALTGVAKYGSVGLAAQRVGLSVSALHKAAREIENNVGYALFSKNKNRLVVNSIGAELARRLQIAVREMSIASEEIRSLSGQLKGKILLGSLPMIRSSILGQAINRTLCLAPDLQFEVQEGVYGTMLSALRKGEIDLLIGALRNPAPAQDVIEKGLFTDPYAIVMRQSHPLATQKATLTALARFGWVVQKEGTPVRAALTSIFEGSALTPRVEVETSSMSLTRSILLESDRLAILSRRQIVIEEKAGLLMPLAFPIISTGRQIGLTTRKDWKPSASHMIFMENFYQILADQMAESSE